MSNIPCSVGILTFNSSKTLRRALESVRDFDDIIVCDGGSVDETLNIARSFGARIILQDKRFLSQEGRIQDFSGVRNQVLAAAFHEWFFSLDSDEYIGLELEEEIRRKIAEEPAAFWVPRKYVYRGTIINCSVAYPSRQMRLFHRGVTKKFIKDVHERIELRQGIVPGRLAQCMFVPVPDTVGGMTAKWRHYLTIENMHRTSPSLRQWVRPASRDVGIAVLYLLRLLRVLFFCRGTRLPAAYELARVWYQLMLIRDSFNTIKWI